MELVKCGRCGVSLTPASCFPPRRSATTASRRDFSFILVPNIHTHNVQISWCHSAVMPILVRSISDTRKSPLQTLAIFFGYFPPPDAWRGMRAISFGTRVVHLHMTIARTYVCVYVWIWWIPIIPSGLFMQGRVSFNNYVCWQSYFLFLSLSLSGLKLKFSQKRAISFSLYKWMSNSFEIVAIIFVIV